MPPLRHPEPAGSQRSGPAAALSRWVDRHPITPQRYRTVVAFAGASLAAIVLTGAAVRLTEAGLGCETWPACSEDRFVPEWELHPWIEFGNRLLSGVVSMLVGLAVLTAYWRQPRRRDLIGWAWGLVAGVVAQIVLGGVTVRVDLHPALVGSHYLLSMALLWMAVVLWVRSEPLLPEVGRPDAPAGMVTAQTRRAPARRPATAAQSGAGTALVAGPVVSRLIVVQGRLLVALAGLVLVTGTLVTGTGPHSGDSRADRLGFDLAAVARVHSVTVWCLAALAVALAVQLQRPPNRATRASRGLVAVIAAQGAIGYIQYALGVPATLVELHIAGSMAVWCGAVVVYLRLFERQIIADREGSEPATSNDARKNNESAADGVKPAVDLDKIEA